MAFLQYDSVKHYNTLFEGTLAIAIQKYILNNADDYHDSLMIIAQNIWYGEISIEQLSEYELNLLKTKWQRIYTFSHDSYNKDLEKTFENEDDEIDICYAMHELEELDYFYFRNN